MTHFVDTKSLRQRGLHDEADVLDSLDEAGSGSRATPPARIQARLTQANSSAKAQSTSSTGAEVAIEQAREGGSESAAGSPEAISRVGASSASSSGSVASSGDGERAETKASNESKQSATNTHTEDYGETVGAEFERHDRRAIDPSDPLSGLYSDRLRQSLEQEAFRNAAPVAQDSAIVEKAKTFSERVKAGNHQPPPLDISRAAQDARIAALEGAIPAWVRGNRELDPALLKASEAASTRALAQPPERIAEPQPSSARSSAPNRSLDR